ncbi:HAMP domain-containing histidine kinase [Labilibacter sediminis]|nr:HAMP domain-containing histidine kinase [Labilibacter sediminis]
MIKKIDKQSLLAGVTFSVLVSLMVIQILFLYRASKLEEKNFNHRVVLALRESRNEIAREARACNYMHNYVCGKQCSAELQYINFQKVDSILSSNLSIHQINLDYKFEFINEHELENHQLCITCYEQSLNGLLEQNGIKLQIEFPNYSKFLYAQMGGLFYVSIGAILFVMISFIFTSRLFRNEKAILANTKDFIDNMVHEFQTPIANVRFASNLLKKKLNKDSDEKAIGYTGLIQSENDKMEGLVEDILRVASMISQKNVKTKFDFHSVLYRCEEIYKLLVQEKGGELILKLDASNSFILGQEDYIRHAVCNLIDNALKYNDKKPKVLIHTYSKNNKFYLAVSDNGIGISSRDYRNIFEKYYRVSTGDVHDIKGFGIGLDFVKKVADNHQATIDIESELGKGSTFVIKFKQG